MENGNHYEHHLQEEEIIVQKMSSETLDNNMDTDGAKVSSESTECLNNLKIAETEPVTCEDNSNNASSTQPVEMKGTYEVKKSKPQANHVKVKAKNILGSKIASNTLPMKNEDSKEQKAISNGTLSAISRPKQLIMKNRDGHVKKDPTEMVKTTPSATNGLKSKPVKSEPATFMEKVANSEKLLEKAKLRALSKEPPTKSEGESETTRSPSSEDVKSNRVGKLPSYNFSFKCNERAERRKEFYSKLEEKTHAKEVEKINLQAKSKETQAAEIKMLRKSLTFKATPMPSFYQEPAPAKAELKKIPTTRPKSPKLGRNKSSANEDPVAGSKGIHGANRLSLDERTVRKKAAKQHSTANVKKPLRRSLPRLPSEKTNLALPAKKPTELAPQQENGTNGDDPSPQDVKEPVPGGDPGNTQSMKEDVPLVRDEFQHSAEQEPVAVEH